MDRNSQMQGVVSRTLDPDPDSHQVSNRELGGFCKHDL